MKYRSRKWILNWLQNNLPPKRIAHILRVETMAQDLAQSHQLNPDQAALAGLLHDTAKCYPPQKLLAIAQQHQLSIHPVEQQNPHLLHAPVGAIEAARIFELDDADILDAIRLHTLGEAGMKPLSGVVFLADSLEPGRGESDTLEHLRHLSHRNLWQAIGATCDYTLKHLIKRGHLIHPRMVETRNWAIAQEQKKTVS